MIYRNLVKGIAYLFSLNLLLGGSIGGMATGVFKEDLLGGATVFVPVRTDIEDLPADVERTGGLMSIKFRPNYRQDHPNFNISMSENNIVPLNHCQTPPTFI